MFPQPQTDLCQPVGPSEGGVPILIETLEIGEQIGTSLCLPGSIHLLRCRLGNRSHINVLRWIQRNQLTEIAVKKLIVELESLSVGRGLAQEMVENFTAAKRALAAKSQDSFLPEKKQIIYIYSRCKEIPAKSWPPVSVATFINLIHVSNLGTGDYNYSIRRDMDDIANKEKIEYDKVFSQCHSGAIVLTKGRLSSGNTTLVYIVTRDWIITGNVLRYANMDFLIPLRSLAKVNESLTDILALIYRHKEDHKKLFSDIRSNGEGVCLIIDGPGEYQPQNESTSVIHTLLQKMYLPKAMVVMASHPVSTAKLQCNAPMAKQIGVLGITQQQIFEYIAKFPFSTDVFNLRTYLDLLCNILLTCYLPVNAAMISYLYQKRGDILPTETNIYEYVTRHIFLHKLTYSNEYAQLRPVEHLRGKDEEYFRNVCHLAFDTSIHSKQVIHQCDTEMSLTYEPDSNYAPSLGLVTIDSTAQDYGRDNTYTFLHLAFEDYLAACCLAMLEKKQKRKLQQAVACDHAMGETGVLGFTGSTHTPADLTTMGYAISTTSRPVTELRMSHCDLHADHIRLLLREVSNNKMKCIPTPNLSWKNIGAMVQQF